MKPLDELLKKYKVITPVGPSDWKEAGNVLISKKEYQAAASAYSAGIELGSTDSSLVAVLLSNRAQAYLSLGEPLLALMDAEAALMQDPGFQKSRFRRGRALFDLGRFAEAAEAFRGCEGQEKMVATSLEHEAQVEKGEYNWLALLNECVRDPESLLQVSGYRHRGMELRDNLPGKGRGWVATQDMPKGTLLLTEKAAVLAFPTLVVSKRKSPGDLAVAQMQELMKTSRKFRSQIFDLQLGPGAGEMLTQGEESYEREPVLYLKHVLSSNGFGWSDSTKCNLSQRQQDHGYGLWMQAAMFNHSCVPNATYGFLGDMLIVRLARDVVTGDEITISYVSAHDSIEERDAKLMRRGFRCECELCVRQRAVVTDELSSARFSVFQDFYSGKAVHTLLFWHGLVKLADTIDDFHVSAIVARVVGALSCDKSRDYARAPPLLEEAYKLHVSEPLLESMWQEEVNLCVQAMFAAIAMQDKALAEQWTPRLDGALMKMFPATVVEGLANYTIVAYKMSKQAEEQAKQGPSLQSMMG